MTRGTDKIAFLETYNRWQCNAKTHANRQFTSKIDTIFEDSPLGLDKWLAAMWLLTNCKNGISSYEIGRDRGVSQKSAWHMMRRIRLAMQDDLTGGMLNGEVEVDETFIGGKMRNMHKGRKKELQKDGHRAGKTVVIGALERKGRVRATVASDRTAPTIREHGQGNVDIGSVIFSDEHANFWRMD